MGPLQRHLVASRTAVEGLETHLDTVEGWGRRIAAALAGGGRLLAAGNGGSAAQAQHLTAELVGRFAADRRPLSAIALHADTSAYTAISNDYGLAEVFARQVDAHGRPGDVVVLLSTSGASSNVLAAAARAAAGGLLPLALTGPAPNPLASACARHIAVDAPTPAAVQEAHLVLIHLLCVAVDATLFSGPAPGAASLEEVPLELRP